MDSKRQTQSTRSMSLPSLDSSARQGNVGRGPTEWTDIGRTLPCSLYHSTYRSTARPSIHLPQEISSIRERGRCNLRLSRRHRPRTHQGNADEPPLRSSSDGQSSRELLGVLAIEIVFSGIFHEPVEPSIRFQDPSSTEGPLKLPADVLFPKVRFLGESLDGRIAPRFTRVATLREDRK
jgi:hypothetical protein